MTHDADINDSEDGEDAGDAVAAFDALRLAVETQSASLAQQIADLRHEVEAASAGIDRIGRGPDTSGDLDRILKSLGQVSGQLQAIQTAQSPIEAAADRYVQKFEASGTAMLRAAITVFGKSSDELRGVSEELGERLALAKGRYVRLKFLGLAGGGGAAIGAVAGVLMALFLPRFLPASEVGKLYVCRPCGLDEQSRALRLPGRGGQGEEKAALPVRHWRGERGLKERHFGYQDIRIARAIQTEIGERASLRLANFAKGEGEAGSALTDVRPPERRTKDLRSCHEAWSS